MSLSRRAFIAALAALGAAPAALRAQSLRTIAWYGIGGPDDFLPYLNSLQAGLKKAGWEEGRNLRILRFASAKYPDDFAAVVPQVMAANGGTSDAPVSGSHFRLHRPRGIRC